MTGVWKVPGFAWRVGVSLLLLMVAIRIFLPNAIRRRPALPRSVDRQAPSAVASPATHAPVRNVYRGMGVEMVQTVEEVQGGTRQALRELHMRARREGWSPVDLSKQEAAKDIPPEAMAALRKMTVYEDKENVHLFSFTETESGTVYVHHQRVRKPTAGPGGGPPPLATEAGESHGSLARMVVGETVMSIDRESDGVVTLVSRSSLSSEQTRAAAGRRLTEWGWHQQSLTPGALPGDGDPFAGNRWQRNGDSCLLVCQDAENGGTTCMYRFSLAQ